MAAAVALLAGGVAAQTARPLEINAGASVGLTATDNQGLTSSAARAEAALSAGVDVHLRARAGRTEGFVDYALTGLHYTRDTQSDQFQNALNAKLSTALVENRLFVDVAGQVAQQRRSVFAGSTDNTFGGDNLTEVSTFRVQPRAQGPLGGLGFYEAQIEQSATRDDQSNVGDSDTTSGLVGWNSGTLLGRTQLGASVVGNIYRFERGERSTQAQARLRASWSATPDLTLTASAGREVNDFRTPEREGSNLYGAGLRWTPTPRTVIALQAEHQFFGTAHQVTLSHRLPRTAFVFNSRRSVVAPDANRARGSLGSAYDVVSLQYQALYPDPVQRDAAVRAFLAANGINPLSQVLTDFLASSVSLQRRDDLAISWRAQRQTLTLVLARSNDRRIASLTAPEVGGDFSRSAVIRQQSVSLTLTHTLTPSSSLTFDILAQRTRGDADAPTTRQSGYGLQWSSQWSRNLSVNLGARHTEFDSPTNPYEATTAFTTMRVEF